MTPPSFKVDIVFSCDFPKLWKTTFLPTPKWVKQLSELVFVYTPFSTCSAQKLEISFLLTDNATIQHLNKTYRGYDKPTNVLAFPSQPADFFRGTPPFSKALQEKPLLLGDVVCALETIVEESKQFMIPFEHHLTHLLIHGMLHLLGYDHQEEEKALEMETLEQQILAACRIPNPYENPLWGEKQ